MVRTVLMGWKEARAQAAPVRFEVFVEEQGVPREIELDDMDEPSLHALAYDSSGNVIGTGRLLPAQREGNQVVGHIGRLAVRRNWRGRGVGGAILCALIEAARARGDAQVALSAQTHALGFYLAHGFRVEGAQYMEAEIPHQAMRLDIQAHPA
jgi:predicted GNAT family N-acyltransferase